MGAAHNLLVVFCALIALHNQSISDVMICPLQHALLRCSPSRLCRKATRRLKSWSAGSCEVGQCQELQTRGGCSCAALPAAQQWQPD